MKDIKNIFIPHSSNAQVKDNEEQGNYSSHVLHKLKNGWKTRSLGPIDSMIHYIIMVSAQAQGTTLFPRLT